ncbi:MAG: major facilitator [Planctomycetota bacterium]|nr:MAG: major facilitator [Planctomycetota bacterium]
MTRLSPRTLAVAFGQDLSLFVAWSVIPVWAKLEAHATPAQLGFLPVAGGLAYVVTSWAAGKLSDRVSRTMLARIGFVGFAAFCLLAWQAKSLTWIYAVSPIGGVANALIWPGLQALVGDESAPEDLEKNLGTFSLAWSVGKTLGFFVGGFAWDHLKLDALAACGVLSFALAFIVQGRPARHRAVAAPLVRHDGPPDVLRAAYLKAAWLANFAAYGLGATLNFLYEDRVVALGRPTSHYNYVLAALFLAQTVSFWFFGRFSGWRYRPGAFLAWQTAGAAALAVIGWGVSLPLAITAALAAGASLGLAYAASIYYSVHSDENRGERAGIHEAVIGASNFAIPMAAGFLQERTGFAPAGYLFAAALVLVAIGAQGVILSRAAKRI